MGGRVQLTEAIKEVYEWEIKNVNFANMENR